MRVKKKEKTHLKKTFPHAIYTIKKNNAPQIFTEKRHKETEYKAQT